MRGIKIAKTDGDGIFKFISMAEAVCLAGIAHAPGAAQVSKILHVANKGLLRRGNKRKNKLAGNQQVCKLVCQRIELNENAN